MTYAPPTQASALADCQNALRALLPTIKTDWRNAPQVDALGLARSALDAADTVTRRALRDQEDAERFDAVQVKGIAA